MISMKSVFLLLAVAAVIHADDPDFCGYSECPDFSETSTSGDYTIRTYTGRIAWAKASGGSTTWMGSSSLFRKLFRYIRDNDIEMTVPVLMKTDADSSNADMYFYLNVDSPPNPSSGSGVSVVYMVDKKFYVKSFIKKQRQGIFRMFRMRSMATNSDFEGAVQALRDEIDDESLYDASSYYQVSYTSPWHDGDRYYEVWLEKL